VALLAGVRAPDAVLEVHGCERDAQAFDRLVDDVRVRWMAELHHVEKGDVCASQAVDPLPFR
jgi:hypothetical protein